MSDRCNNKCGLFDFMANEVGIKVLHPGGYKATKELCSMCNMDERSHVLDLACGAGTSSFFMVPDRLWADRPLIARQECETRSCTSFSSRATH